MGALNERFDFTVPRVTLIVTNAAKGFVVRSLVHRWPNGQVGGMTCGLVVDGTKRKIVD